VHLVSFIIRIYYDAVYLNGNLVLWYIKVSLHKCVWNMLLFGTKFALNQDFLFLCVVFHRDWCSSTGGLRLTSY